MTSGQYVEDKRLLFTGQHRFAQTLRRVCGLVVLHDNAVGLIEQRADLLRSAVVFLHAGFEDCFREFIYLLARRSPELLQRGKFRLLRTGENDDAGALYRIAKDYLNKSVQDLVDASVEAKLSNATFNNKEDVEKWLACCEVSPYPGFIAGSIDVLAEMIDRRHDIVHRADHPTSVSRTMADGGNPYVGASLNREDVLRWLLAARYFADGLKHQYDKSDLLAGTSSTEECDMSIAYVRARLAPGGKWTLTLLSDQGVQLVREFAGSSTLIETWIGG